jgi:hypothetical protein
LNRAVANHSRLEAAVVESQAKIDNITLEWEADCCAFSAL